MGRSSVHEADKGVTGPYWHSLREGKLSVQRCDNCGKYIFMPRICCPHCQNTDLTWVPVSGRGVIWASTEVHRAPSTEFKARTPYWVVLVRLEEGPMVMANYIVDESTDLPVPNTRVVAEVLESTREKDMPLLAFRRNT